MNTKAKLTLAASCLQQLVALSWFTILQNDPSSYTQHNLTEWGIIIATSGVVLALGVVITWRGLLSNPHSPDGGQPEIEPETKP